MSAAWIDLMDAGKPHICWMHGRWTCVSSRPDQHGVGVSPFGAYVNWMFGRWYGR